MSDLTQEIEGGVAEFAGSDDNNSQMERPDSDNNDSGTRNEERGPTEQLSGAGAGAGGVEGMADNYVNKVVDTVASEEGVPGMADGMINKDVDAGVNKVL